MYIDYIIVGIIFLGLMTASLKIGVSLLKKSKIFAFLIPVLLYIPVALFNVVFDGSDIGGAILGIISMTGLGITILINSAVLIIIWLREKRRI